MEAITDTTAASVPFLYRYESPREAAAAPSLAAFSLQLRIYLLLRAFFFFLLRRRLAVFPPAARSPVALPPPDENPLSPAPLVAPAARPAVISAQYAAAASATAGIAVDESGVDLELQKAVNGPAIRVAQQVEITRVNRWAFRAALTRRYLSCSLLGAPTGAKPAGGASSGGSAGATMYLAIGRSQLSLLEMMRGSLKDAVVRLVFSLHELVDICVENNTRRVLSILVQTDKRLENCEKLVGYSLQNRPGKVVYKLLLQFATAQTCLEAQRCIMVARNKDMEKRNRDVGVRSGLRTDRIAAVEQRQSARCAGRCGGVLGERVGKAAASQDD